jgi:hypothetical protein
MAKNKIPESPADLPSAISSYEKESSEAESKLRDAKAAKKVTRARNSRNVNRPNK